MARTEGKREEPRERLSAKPAPKRPNLPTIDDQASESTGMGKRILIGAIGLAVLAGVVALSVTLANTEDPADSLPTVNVDITSGDPLTIFDGTASVDPGLGLVAPEVSSVDFAGNASGIIHDGTPKLVVFLAHWCSHCQREVPALQSWIDENGIPEGVEFISVATSINEARPNYPPNAWLENEGWTPRVVVDDGASTIGGVYGLSAFPYYVMLDGDGNVLQRISGEQDPATVGVFLEALALATSAEG